MAASLSVLKSCGGALAVRTTGFMHPALASFLFVMHADDQVGVRKGTHTPHPGRSARYALPCPSLQCFKSAEQGMQEYSPVFLFQEACTEGLSHAHMLPVVTCRPAPDIDSSTGDLLGGPGRRIARRPDL